jgi:teichuronic acid biosynthesis glycosyltransferase TuaH
LYGTDDYVAGARLMGLSSRWLEGLEAQCLEDADVVLAVSDDLASKWHEQGRNVNVLPNGCKPLPESAGARSDDEAIVSPGAGDGDGRPVVGLIGQLSSRINMTLLEALADGGLRMVLVGPVDPQWEPERFAALQARPTVQWTGRVPAEALPDLLASMDVGITPYADSAFNRASFPLKTLEYLAAGLPAVVTDIPASQWLRNDLVEALGADAAAHHLAVATDPDQFVSSVRRLGLQRNAILRKERRQYAETHSWAARARQLDAVLGPVQ